jgi:gamma-glutamyltranspeptidase/glutathione hydrolase
VARALRSVAAKGRSGFYEGEFGEGLMALGGGLYSVDDLSGSQADWIDPLTTAAFDHELHTIPPNSQGYLTLGALRLAETFGVPDDPDDAAWAHLLIECATAAAYDRPQRLHDRADGPAMIAEIAGRTSLVDRSQTSRRWAPADDGDTRGLGFSLERGHPAELAPGRRPPHTLCPALATRGTDLAAVFGTMGGDAQPQILLQVATRLFRHGQSPDRAIRSGSWALRGPSTGFDTWTSGVAPTVQVEGHAPESWTRDLAACGHAVERALPYDSAFGHAHAIVIKHGGVLAGAADPRTVVGACAAI